MPTLGITCVDTKFYSKTKVALERTLETLNHLDIKKIYWFSDQPLQIDTSVTIQHIQIPQIDNTLEEVCFQKVYSEVMLRQCPKLVEEDFNLIIHADGYAVNKDAWTDEFWNYDYTGAVWKKWTWWCENLVGNGGFCLRSKKLLSALDALNLPTDVDDYPGTVLEKDWLASQGYAKQLRYIPEDDIICRWYRQKLEKEFGIKFAPLALADQFSIERNFESPWLGKSLGFHGKHGVHEFYGVEI
jgi:hypothetical protein